MKKYFKKLSCALLTFVMVLAMTPLGVSAADIYYEKSSVIYFSGSNNYNSLYIGDLSSKQKIAKSSVKVSGSAIKLQALDKNSWSNHSEYFTTGVKPYSYSSNTYYIRYQIKKTGNAKISFKVGSKTYTSTVKILPYTNPLSKLTVTGVKGNLASKFKKSGSATAKVSKAQKNATIQCKAAKNWKITSISYNDNIKKLYRNINSQNGVGVASLSLPIGSLSAKSGNYLNVNLYNTQTHGYVNCTLELN